jgi:hypothetical protein
MSGQSRRDRIGDLWWRRAVRRSIYGMAGPASWAFEMDYLRTGMGWAISTTCICVGVVWSALVMNDVTMQCMEMGRAALMFLITCTR